MVAAYRQILAEFPDVVNESKRMPPVAHQVVNHIVTAGPPIAAKFCRLDGKKLEAAKAEFKQLEADGIITHIIFHKEAGLLTLTLKSFLRTMNLACVTTIKL
jgi:hypothetical protein